MTNSTARTFAAFQRLERCKSDGEIILKGHLKKCKVCELIVLKPKLYFSAISLKKANILGKI